MSHNENQGSDPQNLGVEVVNSEATYLIRTDIGIPDEKAAAAVNEDGVEITYTADESGLVGTVPDDDWNVIYDEAQDQYRIRIDTTNERVGLPVSVHDEPGTIDISMP